MPSLLLGLGMYLLWGPSCAGVAVVKHLVASCQTYFQCVMSARRNRQTVKPWHQTKGKIPDDETRTRRWRTRLFEKTLKKKNFLSSSSFWNKNYVHSIFTASRPPIRRKTPSRSSTSHRSISFGVFACELCKARAKACEVWLAEILADRKHGRVSLMQEGIPWKSNDHMVEGFWKQVPKTGEDWVLPCSSLETIGP